MYLDPGFGGMIVQVIVAIVAVGGGLLYSFRKKIRNLFSKDKGESSQTVDFTESDNVDDAVDVLDNETK